MKARRHESLSVHIVAIRPTDDVSHVARHVDEGLRIHGRGIHHHLRFVKLVKERHIASGCEWRSGEPGEAESCCNEDLDGHSHARQADVWRESFPCSVQRESDHMWMSAGRPVCQALDHRAQKLTYSCTLEEDPEEAGSGRQGTRSAV